MKQLRVLLLHEVMNFRVDPLNNRHQIVQNVFCVVHGGIHKVPVGKKNLRILWCQENVTFIENTRVWGCKIATSTLCMVMCFIFVFTLTTDGDILHNTHEKFWNIIYRNTWGDVSRAFPQELLPDALSQPVKRWQQCHGILDSSATEDYVSALEGWYRLALPEDPPFAHLAYLFMSTTIK